MLPTATMPLLRGPSRLFLPLAAWAALAIGSGCEPADPPPRMVPEPVDQAGSGEVGAGGQTTATFIIGGAGGHAATADLPSVRLATWNLHNFSKYGETEFRIDDIAAKITELDADVLAVQELKVAEGSEGQGPQAWDGLLAELELYDGIHNPWSSYDTTVGLIYQPTTTTVLSSRALFEDDGYAFPRPPLEAELVVTEGETSLELTVIVLHLKAFADSVDRRRAACIKLAEHVEAELDGPVVLLGDLNDDPYDAPEHNAFLGTFLDAEPDYHFLTTALPPESVTSLGYYHWVEGEKIDGEFLDHIIVTGGMAQQYETPPPTIHGVPADQYDDWDWTYSDHFPVAVELRPGRAIRRSRRR